MCKKSIRPVITAFLEKRPLKVSNTETDGTALRLFGNTIAYHSDGGIRITDAHWPTVTTKDRLNGLPGVSIRQDKGVWYLNGKMWNGKWALIANDFVRYYKAAENGL